MPEDLFKEASERAKELGYNSFSEYIQFLLQEDLDSESGHIVVRESGEVHYGRSDKKTQKDS